MGDTKWDLVLWRLDQLDEALSSLVRRCGISMRASDVGAPYDGRGDALQEWIDGSARALGVEAEPTELRYDRLHRSIVRRSPLVLRIDWDGAPCFLCVVSAGRYRVRVLTPSGRTEDVRVDDVLVLLRASLEDATRRAGIDRLVLRLDLPPSEQRRLRRAYLRQAVGNRVAVDGWAIRPTPGSDFRRQLRLSGTLRTATAFLAVQTAEYVVWMLAWWLLGRALFTGSIDRWLLLAWSLLLGTLVMVRARSQQLQAAIAIGVGALLKKRLLDGVLHLAPDDTRGSGVGQLVGRTIESESIEALALTGGFAGIAATLQLVAAGLVIAGTSGGVFVLATLIAWTALTFGMVWVLERTRGRWVDARLELTHDLVESMVGFRTRLAQEAPRRWHVNEDAALEGYIERARSMDRATSGLLVVPRGWLLTAIIALFLTTGGRAPLDVTLAISIGAVLLSYGALRQLSAGFTSVIDAVIAWKRVRILFRASRGADGEDARSSRNDGPAQSASDPVIELRSVSYGFPGHSDPVLKDCDLLIRHGDRLLLEGPSGAGKSTLASLLAGLRQPQLGVLRARGIDHTTIGEHAWRRRVALAPQFHENHVLAETFLFNLLMGRRWPPTAEDIRAATEVCLELGLGPLIDRMPGGVHQFVGDTGWQLSHGERSRLYVARALLQGAELVIFDESFAALDPDTLRQCLACVMKRAPAALLIAHP